MGFISVSILIEILHHSFASAIVGRNWVKGAGNLLFLTTSCESTDISMKKKLQWENKANGALSLQSET